MISSKLFWRRLRNIFQFLWGKDFRNFCFYVWLNAVSCSCKRCATYEFGADKHIYLTLRKFGEKVSGFFQQSKRLSFSEKLTVMGELHQT